MRLQSVLSGWFSHEEQIEILQHASSRAARAPREEVALDKLRATAAQLDFGKVCLIGVTVCTLAAATTLLILEPGGWGIFAMMWSAYVLLGGGLWWLNSLQHRQLSAQITDLERSQLDPALLDEALASLQLKNTFLVGVSHQVRTSLNVILGYTDILLEDAMDYPELLGDLDKIHTASHQLSGLIGDVFELSRLDSSTSKAQPVSFQLDEIQDEIVVGLNRQAKTKGNALSLEMEPVPVCLDRVMLGKLIVGLVTLSCESTDNGSIKVRLAVDPKREDRLVLTVVDNGAGLKAEQLEALNKAHLQQQQERAARAMLAALPLLIVSRLARALNGQLELSSLPGEGNNVIVTLPRYLQGA